MKKILVTKSVHWECKNTPFTWKDIKNIKGITNDCIVDTSFDEEDQSYILSVIKKELESDEEFEKRKQQIQRLEILDKKARFEKYLELKKEFEDK
jgi:hypothetical protein